MPDRPRRIHLLVEGQTEETVAREVFAPHLVSNGLWVSTSILVTRRPAGQRWDRGGVSTWAKALGDIRRLLGDTSIDALTTLIDYYGLPPDVPGMSTRPAASPIDRVNHVEDAMARAVGDPRFVPHLVLHELEAWVYAADHLAALRGEPQLADVLHAESREAGGPELVNEGPATAPSKRLARHCSDYVKTLDGPLAIGELGLPELRRRCPHMDAWLLRLGV
jgi:Domain of unknown function (DUF4276)